MKRIILQILIISALSGYCFAQGKSQNYCSLFDSMKYHQQIVKTSAVLFFPAAGKSRVDGGSDKFFYLKSCNNKDYFSEADFSQIKNLEVLAIHIKQPSDRNSPKLYLVTFTGKFLLSYVSSYGHLGWLRARFLVDRIDSIKPINSNYTLPDTKSDAPVSETGSSLININTEFIFSLLGLRFNNQNLDSFLLSNSKISINGELVDNKQISQVLNIEKQGQVAVNTKNVTANKNEWRVQGTITHTLEEKTVKRLNYDNMFLLQKDKSWKLVYSNIMETLY